MSSQILKIQRWRLHTASLGNIALFKNQLTISLNLSIAYMVIAIEENSYQSRFIMNQFEYIAQKIFQYLFQVYGVFYEPFSVTEIVQRKSDRFPSFQNPSFSKSFISFISNPSFVRITQFKRYFNQHVLFEEEKDFCSKWKICIFGDHIFLKEKAKMMNLGGQYK